MPICLLMVKGHMKILSFLYCLSNWLEVSQEHCFASSSCWPFFLLQSEHDWGKLKIDFPVVVYYTSNKRGIQGFCVATEILALKKRGMRCWILTLRYHQNSCCGIHSKGLYLTLIMLEKLEVVLPKLTIVIWRLMRIQEENAVQYCRIVPCC